MRSLWIGPLQCALWLELTHSVTYAPQTHTHTHIHTHTVQVARVFLLPLWDEWSLQSLINCLDLYLLCWLDFSRNICISFEIQIYFVFSFYFLGGRWGERGRAGQRLPKEVIGGTARKRCHKTGWVFHICCFGPIHPRRRSVTLCNRSCLKPVMKRIIQRNRNRTFIFN